MSNVPAINHKNANELILNHDAMNNIMMFATTMASGTVTVPKHLQGNVSDCLAITMQAVQWGMSPFVVAQKTHLVSGNLGYEAQLVNAVVVNSGAIAGRFHYEYGGNWPSGADAWVRCGAVPSGEGEIQWGEPLYPANVTTKNSPLWKTNPKQQAAYLAVKYWARMYCPGAIMGVYTKDELEDQPQEERDVTPQKKSSTLDSLLAESVREKVTYKDLELLVCSAGDVVQMNQTKSDIKAAYESKDIDLDECNKLLDLYGSNLDRVKKETIAAAEFEAALESEDEVQFD